jgi:DNA-binding PadR family transcriptional regulator
MKMKKLTRVQQAAWEAIKYLVEHDKDTWHGFRRERDGIISAKDKWSPPYRTLRGLEVAGLIEIEPDVLYGNSKEFRLTATGRAELAALDTAEAASAPQGDAPGNAPLPEEQRYQAGDKDVEIAALKRQLDATQAALREIHREAVKEVDEYGYVGFCELIAGIADRALTGAVEAGE